MYIIVSKKMYRRSIGMTQKEKGYVGLGVMLVLAAGTVFGSEPLYKAIDTMSAEKVDYTPGTYVGAAQGFGGEVVATVNCGCCWH